MTEKESELCEKAWNRCYEEGGGFCRCPWCKDPDLEEDRAPTDDGARIGCHEDSCPYLLVKSATEEEEIWRVHPELIADIERLYEELEQESDIYSTIVGYPTVECNSFIGGGVGTSWSVSHVWIKDLNDHGFKELLIKEKHRLQEEIDRQNEDEEEDYEEE